MLFHWAKGLGRGRDWGIETLSLVRFGSQVLPSSGQQMQCHHGQSPHRASPRLSYTPGPAVLTTSHSSCPPPLRSAIHQLLPSPALGPGRACVIAQQSAWPPLSVLYVSIIPVAAMLVETVSDQLSLGLRAGTLEPDSVDLTPASGLYSVILGRPPNLASLICKKKKKG